MQKYTLVHNADLKNIVFGQLFSEAQSCANKDSDEVKEKCREAVTHLLAVTIIEEEFAPTGYSDWPNDLFFVKQVGDNFYSLNWGGKVEDISASVNIPQLNFKTPYFLRLLTNRCKIFKEDVDYLESCQIYAPINLDNNETGYLVRRKGITEEDDLRLMFLIPPLQTLYAISSILKGDFSGLNSLAPAVFTTIFPFLIAAFIIRNYDKFKELFKGSSFSKNSS